MQVDQVTLNDLSIFNSNEEESIFHFFNYTETNGGKFWLQHVMSHPLQSVEEILDIQNTIQFLQTIQNSFPRKISNGTIMVIQKFFESNIDAYPSSQNSMNTFGYKLFSKSDYSLSKYSVQHFLEFVKGLKKISELLVSSSTKKISILREKIELYLNKKWIADFVAISHTDNILSKDVLFFANKLRYDFKQECYALIDVYCTIDAYMSVAIAGSKNNFQFPKFIQKDKPYFHANSLYHLLLQNATAYDIELKQEENFLFLTGANMAGKSTFIKAVGVAAYLAHLGFPVPAKETEISFLEGLLSNINIVDNIFKNESYFFNEVKRIKNTVEKIGTNKNWLVLIDELFKGTNIQDAMKCSTTVIEGLQKKQNALFVLSTHLYEIGEQLKQYKNIQFKYFETNVLNSELHFSYHLKDGISNDKLGYLILEKEGVVELLKK